MSSATWLCCSDAVAICWLMPVIRLTAWAIPLNAACTASTLCTLSREICSPRLAVLTARSAPARNEAMI